MVLALSQKKMRYLDKFPLPRLQDGSSLVLIPVDVMDLVVILEVFIKLLGTHEEEHGLQRFGTGANGQSWISLVLVLKTSVTRKEIGSCLTSVRNLGRF